MFERIVRSRDGQLVRIFFEVYEWNGELKGRILRAEPILALARASTEQAATKQTFADSCVLLLCAASKIVSPYHWSVEKKITSPFSELDFLTSIKIRAPSL